MLLMKAYTCKETVTFNSNMYIKLTQRGKQYDSYIK